MVVLAVLGCSPPVEPAPPAEPVTAAPAPARPAAATDPRRGASVVIEGYGLRLTLNPPIQVLRGLPGSPRRDDLRAAWWDVSAPGAGTRTELGLEGFRVVPRLPSQPTATLAVDQVDPRTAVHRVGADGTEVIVGKGFDLGRAATLSRGPDRAVWVVDPDGAALEWTGDAYVLQSADPRSGPGWELLTIPTRPHGPWPSGP